MLLYLILFHSLIQKLFVKFHLKVWKSEVDKNLNTTNQNNSISFHNKIIIW